MSKTGKTTFTTHSPKDAFVGVEAAMTAGKDAVDSMVKASTEAATQGFEKSVEVTKDQVTRLFGPNGAKQFDQVADFSRANLEAMLKASSVAAKGFEEYSKAMMTLTQKSLEKNLEAAKSLMGCRSVKEAVELQSEITRTNIDTMVTEGVRISEIGVQVANDAFAPINARLNATVEKMFKPVAA